MRESAYSAQNKLIIARAPKPSRAFPCYNNTKNPTTTFAETIRPAQNFCEIFVNQKNFSFFPKKLLTTAHFWRIIELPRAKEKNND